MWCFTSTKNKVQIKYFKVKITEMHHIRVWRGYQGYHLAPCILEAR